MARTKLHPRRKHATKAFTCYAIVELKVSGTMEGEDDFETEAVVTTRPMTFDDFASTSWTRDFDAAMEEVVEESLGYEGANLDSTVEASLLGFAITKPRSRLF